MLKIAFRNIFRQKRRTILTVLTMFGGFTLASISIAWSDGSGTMLDKDGNLERETSSQAVAAE